MQKEYLGYIWLLVTFIKGGPIGSSLCEKMLFTSEARAPYMQIVESRASMATVNKTLSKFFNKGMDFLLTDMVLIQVHF